MKNLFILFCFIPFMVSAQQSSRLVASAVYQYDQSGVYDLRDTTVYFFNSDNGGDLWTFTPHKYDSSIRMETDGTTPLEKKRRQVQVIDGNKIIYESQDWDDQNAAWEKYYKAINTYDHQGNRLSSMSFYWVNNSWDTSFRVQYAYNANGDVISELGMQYNSTGGWDSTTEEYAIYNGKKIDTSYVRGVYTTGWEQPMMTIGYHLSNTNSIYLMLYKRSTGWDTLGNNYVTYDNKGNKIIDSAVKKDFSTGIWGTVGATYFMYDNNGDVIEIVSQEKNPAVPGPLVNRSKTIYTYNSYRQRTSITYLSWDMMSSQWGAVVFDDKTYFYYQTYVVGISSVREQKTARLYPNPTGKYIMLDNIDGLSYRIHNMSGQIMKSGIATGAIDVQELPAGNYLIDIGQGNVQMFLKQ